MDNKENEIPQIIYDSSLMEYKKKGSRKKITCITICSLLLVLLFLYGGFIAYFHTHYMWNTYVDGQEVSLKNQSAATQVISNAGNDYTITLLLKDGTFEVLDLSDIDLLIQPDSEINETLKKQTSYLWMRSLFEQQNISVKCDVSFDENRLKLNLEKLDFMNKNNQVRSQDAKVICNNGKFSIEKEIYGNEIDEERLLSEIKNAMNTLETTVDLEQLDCYIKPQTLSDDADLIQKLNVLKTYENLKISYQFGLETESLVCDDFYEWLNVTEDGEVKVNSKKVKAYVNELAKKYDTLNTDRTFVTSKNHKVKVYGSDFGYQMDKKSEIAAIKKAFRKNKSFCREPAYLHTGYGRGVNDIGDTYIEVDLKKQHLYCYKDGKKIYETDIVTGNPNKGNATPGGLYYIKYKESPSILKGATWETKVAFWMPFNGGIGLHDATWQSSFGGDRYLTHGSHGCVNLPYSAAKFIYENFNSGTPVVCYN